jgi:adenosylcobinamide-GDP ribazoletransferase
MDQPWHETAEIRAVLTAVQFLTRIPVPGGMTRDLSTYPEDIQRGLKYFPLLGGVIGALTAATLVLSAYVLPLPVAVLVALAVEALITGAFHEDAVADFFDAFGGGWTRDDVLRILRDSRVGSFGSLGLMLAVGLRAAGLMSCADVTAAAIAVVCAGAMGRAVILAVMAAVPPVPARDGLSKDIGQLASWRTFAVAVTLIAPIIAFALYRDPLGMVAGLLLLAGFIGWFRRYLLRRLGGVTGDCLGFSAYVGMIVITLVFARTR